MSDVTSRSLGSELLKRWREKRLKISQERAALLLEIDHGAMCAFETGYRTPGPRRAARIAEKTSGYVPVSSWEKPARKVA